MSQLRAVGLAATGCVLALVSVRLDRQPQEHRPEVPAAM